MSHNDDIKSMSRSDIVPYIEGESSKDRHHRRLKTNKNATSFIIKWCIENKIELKVSNSGYHWQFKKNGFIAEWWPFSAKLVINKQWEKGIHCHDYKQVIQAIENELSRIT